MLARILIPVLALMCLFPFISSAIALFLGCLVALTLGNPYLAWTRKRTSNLLQAAVVALGAGMNLLVVAKVGAQGIGYTCIGIVTALALGTLFAKLLNTEKTTGLLISVGTAICGGSAIAAVAPVVRAKPHEISVSLGVVFMLNAVALFIFPPIGHFVNLSQHQFGLWSALAIHDTSSVVGASMQYGAEALQIATTVKLARALWIVPVAFAIGWIYSRQNSAGEAGAAATGAAAGKATGKAKKPWFILGFLLVAALVTWVPALEPVAHVVDQIAKRVLVMTLFLIGAGLTRETLRQVGVRPLLQGVGLWIVIASGTLGAILAGWIV